MKIKCALITGASLGIGEALARKLHEQGVELFLSGRDEERLAQLPGETLSCDLTKDREPILQWIREKSPDLVVNNAGYGLYGHALTRTTAEQMNMLELNMMAVTEITLEAARAMATEGIKGTILNVSSVAGHFPFPSFSLYGASKTYVTQLSRALDFEFQAQGIRVLAACPGMIRTGFRARAGGGEAESSKSGVMTADYAADQLLWQVEKGRGVYTFNWPYRLVRLLWSLPIPRRLLMGRLRESIDSRFPEKPLLLNEYTGRI